MSFFDDHYEDYIREINWDWEWDTVDLLLAKIDDTELKKKVRETIASLQPYETMGGDMKKYTQTAWSILMNSLKYNGLTEKQRGFLGKYLLYYGREGYEI
ncbi:hypothetical protein [Bacillus phage SBSphiJ5]|nr:hypothetical protein [Bacillus phage SBSphiJ5]